ncbi:MAG: hypothetical protein SOT28_04815 [Fusicatenibacter sp.]|nr:hypothetical protein [Lachnospiraceae bacterium]MDY2937624.1 hypothetical protein [Fusicatenibacter sp.]
MMKKGKQLVCDCLKIFGIGLAAAAAAAVCLFLGGFLIGDAKVLSGLEVVKDGLLLIFSLGLFVLAGMLLAKGKKPEKFTADNGWRAHFALIGPKTALGIVCVAFLILASAADYFLMKC